MAAVHAVKMELGYDPQSGDEGELGNLCESAMLHLQELGVQSPAITVSEDAEAIWVSLLVSADTPGAAIDQARTFIRTAFHVAGAHTPHWDIRSGEYDAEWANGRSQEGPTPVSA